MKAYVGKLKNFTGQDADLSLSSQPGILNLGSENLVFLAPVSFAGKMLNTGTAILIQGEVTTTVELDCSRCGEKVPLPVRTAFEESYANQSLSVEIDEESSYVFQGDEIDIFPQVVQAILLELPMKIVCRESCRGLCPECGVNLNENQCRCAGTAIDPRLMALQKLLDDSSTEGGVINGSTEKKDIKSE